MIEAFDPISLPLWLLALFAAAQYPLGLMFGAECSLCCCQKCVGPECCSEEWPRPVGVCCTGVWRVDAGTCCDDVWHPVGESPPGVCCEDEWRTEAGVCCPEPYSVPLEFSSCFGSGASGKAVKGSPVDAVLLSPGSGYAKLGRVQPTFTVGGGSGSGLTVSLTLTATNDACGIPTWTITGASFSGGTGYRYITLPNGSVQNTEGLTLLLESGTAIQYGSLEVVSNSSGVPTAVNITNGGAYYAEDVDEPPYVATVTVEIDAVYGSGASLSAIVDDDTSSPTFGQITSLSVDDPGSEYDNWDWQLEPQWHPEGDVGECCDNQWRPEAGVCCESVNSATLAVLETWFPGNPPTCPAGQVFVSVEAPEGFEGDCCECLPDELYDPRVGEMVPTLEITDLACSGCNEITLQLGDGGEELGPLGRCCRPDQLCDQTYESACEDGDWLEGCCDTIGCPAPCCSEDSSGVAQCEIKSNLDCVAPDVIGQGSDCEDACLGACCIEGVYQGQTTQPDCDAVGGCWAGVGSTQCQTGCRPPFSQNCCESVISGASGLTFTQPLRKRCEDSNVTWLVTVTGTTDSEVLVHGVPFGQTATPGKRCPINAAFVVCWDKFNIEPMPCNTSFRRLDVTVCWESPGGSMETLIYSGCDDISLWLSDCTRNCETTLVYNGPGVTVGATVFMQGDATIEANGGAIIFPSAPLIVNGCSRTLTLTGTSTAENSIIMPSQPAIIGVSTSLEKRGSGTWKLTAGSTYNGTTKIFDGTIIVGVNTQPASGAFGTNPSAVEIGGGSTGGARLHLSSGVQFSKWIKVVGTGVSIGGENASGLSDSNGFLLADEDFTLYAATGGAFTMRFLVNNLAGDNYSPAEITIGTASDAGTVLLLNDLATTATIAVSHGTLHVDGEFGSVSQASVLTVNGPTAELRHTADNPISVPVQLAVGAITGNGTINDLTATGGTTIEPDAGGEIVIDTAFAGSGTVEKIGAGTLRITGANTHSGTLDITGGTLAGNFEVIGTLALADGTSVLVQSGQEILVSGAVDGGGTVTKLGDGTLRVTGQNTFAGTLELEAGTLAGDFEIVGVVNVANDATVDADIAGEILLSGTLSGSATLTKDGSGTLRITGVNSFTGELDIQSGGVVVTSLITNPGGLATSATFNSGSLTVAFTANPASGAQYTLLAGSTTQTYGGNVTLTGTTKTGTYNSATATVTIN